MNLKLSTLVLTGLCASASAFFVPMASNSRQATKIAVIKGEQRAIDKALDASKSFGFDSVQARQAWDAVEELNAKTNLRKELDKGLKTTDEFKVYSRHITSLHHLLQSAKTTLNQIDTLTNLLQDEIGASNIHISEELASKLAEARAADEIYGATSSEAQDAWDEVDLVSKKDNVHPLSLSFFTHSTDRCKESALNAHHEYNTVVDHTSIQDGMEAVGKLKHLTKQVEIEYHSLHGPKEDESNLKP